MAETVGPGCLCHRAQATGALTHLLDHRHPAEAVGDLGRIVLPQRVIAGGEPGEGVAST